jgi:hypothetical protein
MEWSNGVIFLIATFCPEGLCSADLEESANNKKPVFLRYDAISALSDDINNLIILRDIKLNLAMTPTRHTLSDGPFTRCRRRRGRRKRFLDNGNRHSRR